MNECPYCEGETFDLGTLGWVQYRRCENCGIEFRVTLKADSKDEQKRRSRWLRAERRAKAHIQKFGYE